jgi:hypothetical protein
VAFAVAIALVMAVALLRRKPRLAVVAALTMGVPVVIAEITKRVLVRPELVEAPPGWLHNSFPSGHVTIAVAIGIGAVIVAPYAFRWLATVVGAIYAMGIAQAVEVAGWHRLSGVIGATLLVLAVACAGLYILARQGRVQPFDRRRLLGAIAATALLALAGLGFTFVGVFFGLGRLVPVPAAVTDGDLLLAYTSTMLIAAGVIALAFLGFLWLIRPCAIDEEPQSKKPVSTPTV